MILKFTGCSIAIYIRVVKGMKVSIRATPTASQHDYKAGGDKV